MEHDLLSVTEAALIYGGSRSSFVWMLGTGRIPYTTIGRRKFVRRVDVEELIKQREAKTHFNSYIAPIQRSA